MREATLHDPPIHAEWPPQAQWVSHAHAVHPPKVKHPNLKTQEGAWPVRLDVVVQSTLFVVGSSGGGPSRGDSFPNSYFFLDFIF